MTLTEISNLRLINQKVASTTLQTPKEVVSWMGAMQAQDYAMATLAVGIRLSETGNNKVEDAINKGDILRTHIMRPTWHFVAAEDIY